LILRRSFQPLAVRRSPDYLLSVAAKPPTLKIYGDSDVETTREAASCLPFQKERASQSF